MARATAALVLPRLGNAYPTGWDAVSVGALCAPADAILDGYTYPVLLSATEPGAIQLCIDIVLRLMRIADMMQSAGGAMSTMGRSYLDMPVLTEEMKERIERLTQNATYDGCTTADLIEEDDIG